MDMSKNSSPADPGARRNRPRPFRFTFMLFRRAQSRRDETPRNRTVASRGGARAASLTPSFRDRNCTRASVSVLAKSDARWLPRKNERFASNRARCDDDIRIAIASGYGYASDAAARAEHVS